MQQNTTTQSASQLPMGEYSPDHDPMAGRALSFRQLCDLAIECQREAWDHVADPEMRRSLAARYFVGAVASLMYCDQHEWDLHDEFLRCLGFDDLCENPA